VGAEFHEIVRGWSFEISLGTPAVPASRNDSASVEFPICCSLPGLALNGVHFIAATASVVSGAAVCDANPEVADGSDVQTG
jgi:hypothetical protein